MLMVGQVIHGFAGGYFGRDQYRCVRIEAVGVDWVVGRGVEGGQLYFAEGPDTHKELGQFIKPQEDCCNANS